MKKSIFVILSSIIVFLSSCTRNNEMECYQIIRKSYPNALIYHDPSDSRNDTNWYVIDSNELYWITTGNSNNGNITSVIKLKKIELK